MKLLLSATFLFVLASCDSTDDSKAQELLREADRITSTKESPAGSQTTPKEGYDFSAAIINTLSAVKQILIQEGLVRIHETSLSAETLPGKVELASLQYQDAKKELEKLKKGYDEAVLKMEATAPDSATLADVKKAISSYRHEYGMADRALRTAKAMLTIDPTSYADSVETAEAALKALSGKTYEEIVPYLNDKL